MLIFNQKQMKGERGDEKDCVIDSNIVDRSGAIPALAETRITGYTPGSLPEHLGS